MLIFYWSFCRIVVYNNMFFLLRMAAPEIGKCECNAKVPLVKGWEGSALLHNGSLLRFGCVSFVFSIVDDDCAER